MTQAGHHHSFVSLREMPRHSIAELCSEASRQAKLTQREEDLEDVTADFTGGMGDIFRSQGAMFAAGLEPYKGRFTESVHGSVGPSYIIENKPLLYNEMQAPRKLVEQDEPSPVDDVWPQVWANVSRETEDAIIEEFTAAASLALETGGEAAIAALGLAIDWEMTNPAVLSYLETEAARFVKNVDDETIRRLNVIIRNAANARSSYSELAAQIIDSFAFMADTRPQTHIRSRAELIAVTELGNAYEEANMIVARDLQAAGITMLKEWNNRGDSRVSDGCIDNGNAGLIPLNAEWPSTEGTYDRQRPLRFPGCRCWQTTEIDPAAREKARAEFGA